MKFDSGVKEYIVGTAIVSVGFPVDWKGNACVSCIYCQFYSQSSRRCQLNKEIVAFPEKYVGDFCPLEMEEK